MQLTIGGRRIEPEDVVLVACCPAADTVQLVIEQPRIDSLSTRDAAQQAPQKGKKADASAQPPSAPAQPSRPADGDALGETEVRAVLTVKLVQMLHARAPLSQGLKTAQLLAALINARGHPVLRMDSEGDAAVLAQLADALSGASSAFIIVKGDSLPAPAALSRLGLQPVPLSAADRASFCCGLAVSTALGVLAVHSARALLDGCDNLAALTAEAAECPLEPFAIAHHDQARTHSGQVAVASNLRTLLDGSKIVEKALSKSSAPAALALVPQLHGPARDAFNTALKAVRTELNAVEGGSESAQWAEFHPQPLVQPLAALHSALATLGAASESRIQLLAALQKGLAQPTVTEALDSLLSAVSATVQQLSSGAAHTNQQLTAVAQSDASDHKTAEREGGLRLVEAVRTACGRVTSVLSVEALVALLIVDHRDRAAIQSSIEAIHKKEEALKKREAELKAKADAGGKPGKEPKAAEKVDRRPQGLYLASRTASLRAYLHSSTGRAEPGPDYPAGSTVAIAASPSPQQELKRFYDAFQRALDPLNTAFRELAAQALVSSNVMVKPKVPKGTKDSLPREIAIREKVFGKIIEIFRRHGAVGIDTPVFELKETLTNKYGEDSKLIYDLADQGGEMLSLRYDLTVPLARYIATHNVDKIKRYHIGRVYRRDNPVMSKGRFREFYQCDYDIAGVYAPMVPDAEVIKTFVEILEELDVGAFLVKVNHRKLLDAVMAVCGVPPAKFRPICSAIDKLDKEEWETVKAEMVQQKGLPEPVADRIGTYVKRRSDQHLSPAQLLKMLREDANFQKGSKALTEEAHAMAETAFTELGLFFEYLEAMGCINRITFDLSLARGLDYYTGVIYEAILTGQNQVGSIGAGGRYDDLVRSFCGRHVPVVGVSVGIERIFNILYEREKQRTKGGVIRASQTQVLVASVGSNMLLHRMALCNELWAAGIKAEFLFDLSPKPQKQIDYCFENQIPFVIWLGGDEIRDGVVKFKNLVKEEQITVNRRDIVKHLLKLLEDPLPELPPPPAAPAEEEKEAGVKDSKPKENKPKEGKPKESKPKESQPKESKPKENKKKDAQ